MTKRLVGILMLVGLIVACQRESVPPPSAPAPRLIDPAKVAMGEKVFRAHCAACHGQRAEGAPQWQRPGPDGKYPPPPLDGSAHAWHHPMVWLKQTIREGTLAKGGGMPAWGDKLNEQEIDAVIHWFQSLWSDEVYQAWVTIDARAR